VPDWRDRLRGIWAEISGRRRSSDVYTDLRSMALGIDPASIQTPAAEPWAGAAVAAMELSVSGATATILAVADGTVSMYLSTGGGTIGAGEHAAVRAEGQRFRTVVADSRGQLVRTAEFPLPRAGEVRFHARVGEDRFTGVAPEAALRAGRHVLAPLYAAGQDLLTEIRLASEPGES
jgi:hypothetical protein